LFERIMSAVAGSYLKADPKGFGREVKLAVYITSEGAGADAARSLVEQARGQLKEAPEARGYGLAVEE
jgi:hypothetical protein